MTTVAIKMNGKIIRVVENVPLVFWAGPDMQGQKCQVCSNKIDDIFYDMRTKPGLFKEAWGTLCSDCAFKGIGVGQCGLGFGQEYRRQKKGQWLMTTPFE